MTGNSSHTGTASITVMHFTDARIEQIVTGMGVLSQAERDFLVNDTANFEEAFPEDRESLRKMSDSELMAFSYRVWADYASTQV